MIGTNIRGLRHLSRVVSDTSLKEVLINFRDFGYRFCHAVKIPATPASYEKLVIFNSHYSWGHRGIGHCVPCTKLNSELQRFVLDRYAKVMEFEPSYSRHSDIYNYITEIILLPDDFEANFEAFLSSNAKMIRTLANKYGFDPHDDYSKRIYAYTDGSKNFYQWAIINRYQNYITFNTIKRIMNWNSIYGQLAKKLQKGTITAYNSPIDIITLISEMDALRKEKRVSDVINMFNTAQKRLLREAELSDAEKNIMSRFYRLSDTKRTNFIRKMSTINDVKEIMHQMAHVTSAQFEWNKDSFMDFITNIENMNFEKIFETKDVVLVKVNDYETIKYLARSTNWCISKNKTYWNQYVEQRPESTQYVVFDFSKKEDDLLSIIGFTTEYNRGITHAHDFTNNDMMKSNPNTEAIFLKSFVSNFKNKQGIFNALKNCGIDITMVVQYDKPLFEWTKEKMYEYLFECVKKENVDILSDKGDLVAISVRDEDVKYFLGDPYMDAINNGMYGWQHIIFMDFSMSEYDPNRIQYALIKRQNDREEDYCTNLFNAHAQPLPNDFETKLCQYGLPYDIIRRSDNKRMRIRNAFNSSNIPLLVELFKGIDVDTIRDVIYNYVEENNAINIITDSIVNNVSFDYLNLFYDKGLRLRDIFDAEYINALFKGLVNAFITYGRNGTMDGTYPVPTKEELDAFYSNNSPNIEQAYYIGTYLAIIMIVSHEASKTECRQNTMYKRLLNGILMTRKGSEAFNEIMKLVGMQLNFEAGGDAVFSWVGYVFVNGDKELKDYAMSLMDKYPKVKHVWDELEARINKDKSVPHPPIGLVLPGVEDEDEHGEFMDDEDIFIDDDEEEYEEEEAEPQEAF